jgi:tRNA_anti-like
MEKSMIALHARNVLGALMVALAVSSVVGCGGPTPPPSIDRDPSRPATGREKPESSAIEQEKGPQAGKQSVQISVDLLMKEIKADPDGANKKYGDQPLIIDGVIEDSNYQGGDGSPRIVLQGPDNSLAICFFTKTTHQAIGKLTNGQKVKIGGKCGPMRINYASMYACELVEAGPDPAISISAEQLAAEFAKDQEATKKKYAGKPVIVEGVIAKISHKPGTGERRIFLRGTNEKADNPIRILAEFHVDHEKALSILKVGQKVKVKGEFIGELHGAVFVSNVRLTE